ncbi:fibronectin type III domain-containing protein 1 [Spea bombifrons]|uniref:fibronectin type III domain-containing protein 1 n=1 Tax=Spea bombifrons TaxID=233779 RepID=UPI00234B7CD6|nr:fibronectin type III domain-containing protein 1 [Spea bombifrons]
MAERNGTCKTSAVISLLALMMLTFLDLSAAATEKKVPSRPYRMRARSSAQRSFAPQSAGLRSTRRFLSNAGESSRRAYAPRKPVVQEQENAQRASESVHLVSVQSMNPQEKSQPVYRAAVTKLKIPEDNHLLEPKDLSIRVISSQSVLVTWVDPLYEKSANIGSNREYTVRYREKGESARWDYKTINTRRAMVDDLLPDAMYEFSVRISQGDKEGHWSPSVFQRTPESPPTSAPENLYVAPLNGKKTAVRAMWDKLSDSNGRIKEYIISYAPAMKPFGAKSVSYSGTSTSAIIDGLQPGERYIFKIRAANRRGQGPQSKAFTVIMPGSATPKDLYSESPTKDVLKGENKKNKKDEESSLEDTLDFPKSSLKLNSKLSNTHENPGRKDTFLDSNPESSEDLKDIEITTTLAPKTSATPQRRRIRPFSSNDPLNTGRRPFRINPLYLGRNINGRKSVSPTVPVDENNETKNSELEDDKHLSERNLPSKTMDKSPREREEDTEEQDNVPLKDVTTKFSNIDSSPAGKDDSESHLEISKSLSASSYTLKKGNQRTSLSRVPNKQSSTPTRSPAANPPNSSSHLHSTSLLEKEKDIPENANKYDSSPAITKETNYGIPHTSIKRKPQAKVTTPRKISLDSNKQSHSVALSNRAKETMSSAGRNSGNIDPESEEANNDRSSFSNAPEGEEAISDVFDPEKSLQNKKASTLHPITKTSSTSDEKNIYSVKNSGFSGYKTTKTTVSSTIRTLSPTTPSATTTESPTTSESYKENISKFNKYHIKKIDTDAKVSSSNQQPSVTSVSGKSALSILEYYRRRSSQLKPNTGSKYIPKSNPKTSSSVIVHTTAILTTTSPTTALVLKHLESKNINAEKRDTPLKQTQVHPKPLSNEQSSDHLLISHSSATQLSKQPNENPTSVLMTPKQKEKYDLPNKEENINGKADLSKPVIRSRTPVRAGHQDFKKATVGQPIKQNVPDDETMQHRVKSSAIKKGEISTDIEQVNLGHQGHELEEEGIKESKLTNPTLSRNSPASSLTPSSYPKEHYPSIAKAVVPQVKNTEGIYNTGNQHSESSNSYLPSNRNIGFTRTSASKPHTSTSDVDDSLKYGSALPKTDISTKEISKPSLKPEQSEYEKNLKPTSRTRQGPYSNTGASKHRNVNGNVFNKKNVIDTSFSQKQSATLDEEEGLSAPPTVKENTHKTARIFPSYTNKHSVIARNSPRSTTTVAPYTNRPLSSTRASPYRLIPSVARQLNIGRSYYSRTTPSPTTSPVRTASPTLSSRHRILNSRFGSPGRRPYGRPFYRQGNNGRPYLMSRGNGNRNVPASSNGNLNGQRMIYGPEGTKWVVDLNRGLVLNTEGRYLQDSHGKPLRIKLGGDGRTIVDLQGTPVVSPDGLPLFGNGRFSKPLASPQDKPVLSLGGRPLRGLEVARTTRIPTTRMTTTLPTTTTTTATTTLPTTTLPTTTTTTTTPEPTTEPTTVPTTEEIPYPTCPPGSYTQYDEEGNLIMGPDDKPDCYEEDSFSGQDFIVSTEAAETVTDYEIIKTTQPPVKITPPPPPPPPSFTEESEIKSFGTNLVSEYDVAGKKRFTAPYVSYISKDPNTPCSLTDALDHFQVENLEDIIPKDFKEGVLPPQNISYNITVVAVEGCHSFVILDWAKPKKGDFITGYLVYSASYDDFLRNKWSTRNAAATSFPVENLKPNTRYYFKIQAKNPYGFGPVSPSVSFVTESDNPLLIVRPPGGEPIWIPFAFKHDSSFSGCNGKQYVKRTWYRKFVGVVLCNSLRYKIYLSENLRDTFYSIGDSWGRGEDHCQFVDSYMEGRTGPLSEIDILPMVDGYYRHYIQEPVKFGQIGYGTPHNYVGWYECGVPIPGKW